MNIKHLLLFITSTLLLFGCSSWQNLEISPDSVNIDSSQQTITLKASKGELGGALDLKVIYALTDDAICDYEYSTDFGFIRVKGNWFYIQCFRWSDEITISLSENNTGKPRKLTIDFTRAFASQKGYTVITQDKKR